MAMTWTSLSAAKGVSGSIANWVSYTKLDVPVIVDEAQALAYSLLRCREMITDTQFLMPAGGSYTPLPARFLDPIGRIYRTSFNDTVRHKDSGTVQNLRNYSELSGTLGTNPFTTVTSSTAVTVALTGHGFSQDSVFNASGATVFNGVTINGTFPITAIVDANNFTVDISSVGTPSGSGAGGGASVAYLCDNLVQYYPQYFGVWNERIYFDAAFTQQSLCKLQYFQSLPLLSASNQNNFLTDRYPQLMRTACVTSAADFMKDDTEYQKGLTRLTALVQRINVENDMMMRGMEITTDTP